MGSLLYTLMYFFALWLWKSWKSSAFLYLQYRVKSENRTLFYLCKVIKAKRLQAQVYLYIPWMLSRIAQFHTFGIKPMLLWVFFFFPFSFFHYVLYTLCQTNKSAHCSRVRQIFSLSIWDKQILCFYPYLPGGTLGLATRKRKQILPYWHTKK